MKTGKKLLSLLLVVIMAFSLCGGVFAADKDIVILHTNDVHGEYAKNIGYAGVAAYKAEMEKSSYVTLVDAGDFSQGAAMAILSKGEYLVNIMNQVGYDIVVPGNHEFDYGMAQALKNLEALDATVVSCNFIDLATKAPVFDAYKLVTYGDVDVAYVGVSTPETYTKSTPSYFQDASGNYIYDFSQGTGFYSTIQTAVDAAKAAGAEYVVAVGHCGIDPQSSPWTSKEIIANTTGIDVFIDGHSHSKIENEAVKNKDGKNVVLAQTGEKLANLGKVTIKADGSITAELITDYTAKDETVATYIKGIEATYKEYTSQVVAKSSVDLDGVKQNVRTGETNMGDLIADAYRVEMGADIGLMNGGGIRASIAAGDIKIDDILAVMTFGNMATAVKLTGQQIKDCLEMGASAYPTASGGFTHVSGMTYTIDATIESSVVKDDKGNFSKVDGEYRVRDIMVGDKPIDLAKTYTVACHSYWLTQYGDGMTMFKGAEVIEEKHEKVVDNVMLVNYIQQELKGVIGETYAKPQGRITIKRTVDSIFTDVVAGAWYVPSVQYGYDKGYMIGSTDTAFGVSGTLTNAQFFTILYRFGYEAGMYGKYDTEGSNWMAGANFCAKALGLTVADMAAPMLRGEMAGAAAAYVKAYCDYAKKTAAATEVAAFADSEGNANAEGIEYLHSIGVLDGYEDNTFKPQNSITRAEVAKVVNFLATKITYKTATSSLAA